ncbi:FmdB family zinc ribbon protein [Rathayibacter soli]|uniref:hypothetical protein n=1 Tax=Rathayibacter soli TaxID=3144168 RepID=UPI003908197D
MFGTVGVTFNGSGFYRTDSRASNAALAPAKGDKHGGDKHGGDKKDKKGKKEPVGASASASGTSAGASGAASGTSPNGGSRSSSASSAKTPASSS